MSRGFNGIPGGMGNIQGLMKQAQKMQEQMAKVKEEAEAFVADGNAGGGMVTVKVNGKFQLVACAIKKEVVNPDDVEMLQDLIIAAVNDGVAKVQDNLQKQMSKATGGMSIPGLF